MKQRSASPWLTGFLVLVVVGLVLGALWMSQPDPPQQMAPEPAAAPVHVRVLEATHRNHRVRIYGQTKAWKRTTLAVDQSGLVTWRAPQLEIGQRLEPGMPLVRIDRERAELGVQAAQAALHSAEQTVAWRAADVAVAEAELENATRAEPVALREWERQKAMVEGGAGPIAAADRAELAWIAATGRLERAKVSVASAQAAVVVAHSQVKAADVGVRQAGLGLERAELKAPIAGEVVASMVEVGQWLAPGMPVCEIADRSRLLVEAQLPNADRVADWSEVQLEVIFPAILDAVGLPLKLNAAFHGLAPLASPQSRARMLQLKFDNASLDLPAGAFAEVWVDQGPQSAIWLRPSEFRVGDHGPEAVVVKGDQAWVKQLRFGRVLVDADGRTWHPVLEGLQDGDIIAIDNLETPSHGDPVLVLQ
jgi:multidrug efflux pump subunit AcrA (membrane-fusion protein)